MKCFNILLVVAASLLIGLSSARAEILNLDCTDHLGPMSIVYWVDLDAKTITVANARNQQVQAITKQTYQVQITPEAFNFSTSMGPVTINRVTGVNFWYGGNTQTYRCTKAKIPFLASPATKF
jgi:hypothetical protein